jgi:hypothetical protein
MKERCRSYKCGALFVPLLGMTLAIFLLTLWTCDVARLSYWQGKIQAVSDSILLSSLRLRAEALQKIAEKWAAIEPLLVAGDSAGMKIYPGAEVWRDLETKLSDLKAAIPGYKGRISGVRTIVAKANGLNPEAVVILQNSAFNLGLVNEPQKVRNDLGEEKVLPFVWLRRSWAGSDRLGSPEETSEVMGQVSFQPAGVLFFHQLGERWVARARSRGLIFWDVPQEEQWMKDQGNGGFPRNWDEALYTGAVKPNRFALYGAKLCAENDL